MRKKVLAAVVLAGALSIGAIAAVQSNNVFAKNKPTPAERMALYSPPNHKTGTKTVIRQSRVGSQNIVTEAANVLHCLPADIINEMKNGKTLAQVAKDKGLTEVEFNKKLTDYDTKLTDAATKDGEISKEQANAIKSGRTDRINNGMKQKAMKASDHQVMDMGNN